GEGGGAEVPGEAAALGLAAPLHALITGPPDERDRRVVLLAAPRFGIVGQSQTVVYRVEDSGVPPATAQVTVRRDGDTLESRSVRSGERVSVQIPIPHAGANIVEIEASPLEGELTPV